MSILEEQARQQYRQAIRRIDDGAAYRAWQIAQDLEAVKRALGVLRSRPIALSKLDQQEGA